MTHPIIYWFRNDLRLRNNEALNRAVAQKQPILFVYMFDEAQDADTGLGFIRMSAHRRTFLENTLFELKNELAELGHTLNIYYGDPLHLFQELVRIHKPSSIFAQAEYAYEEKQLENQIAGMVPLHLTFGSTLFTPESVSFPVEKSPFYYTAFLNKVSVLPLETTAQGALLEAKAYDAHNSTLGTYQIQSKPFHLPAGEVVARQKVLEYVSSSAIDDYVSSREFFMGDHYSTFWSPYLALGVINVREVVALIQKHAGHRESAQPSVQKLTEQLIWREYYRFLMLRYGSRLFWRHGLRNKNRDRHDDREAFDKWRLGETGSPLIDAFMKELLHTGFLSNRGRMLASYYLAKVMEVNWLWGAQWFESALIDYDVCNNYGNWAYQSGTGTDSRVNRRFNIEKQISKFDPKHEYIHKWNKPSL